jgi:hypothetical protein
MVANSHASVATIIIRARGSSISGFSASARLTRSCTCFSNYAGHTEGYTVTFAGVKNRRAIKYHWGSSKHKIELRVSKDYTQRFSSSTHFNKSLTGVGTILSSFLPLVECMLAFQMLVSAPCVILRSQLMKSSTPILLALSAVVE